MAKEVPTQIRQMQQSRCSVRRPLATFRTDYPRAAVGVFCSFVFEARIRLMHIKRLEAHGNFRIGRWKNATTVTSEISIRVSVAAFASVDSAFPANGAGTSRATP